MRQRTPYPVTEEAKMLVQLLIEAEPDSFDPAREVARLTTYACPECSGTNTTQPDEENLVDCLDCGIWFHPAHPRNKHALLYKREGSICQNCGETKPCRPVRDTYSFLNPGKDKIWLCDTCFRKERQKKRAFWNDFYSHSGGGNPQRGYRRVGESVDPETPEELNRYMLRTPRDWFVTYLKPDGSKERIIVLRKYTEEDASEDFTKYSEKNGLNFSIVSVKPYVRQSRFEAVDPESPEDFKRYALAHGRPPNITISFTTVTPESAADGDYAEQGWVNERGEEFELDEWDKEDGKTIPDIVVPWLQAEDAYEPSSSSFHTGVWYASHIEDIRTGKNTEYNYHLNNFTPQDEERIFQMMTARNY